MFVNVFLSGHEDACKLIVFCISLFNTPLSTNCKDLKAQKEENSQKRKNKKISMDSNPRFSIRVCMLIFIREREMLIHV
jgi:hypothetical protein